MTQTTRTITPLAAKAAAPGCSRERCSPPLDAGERFLSSLDDRLASLGRRVARRAVATHLRYARRAGLRAAGRLHHDGLDPLRNVVVRGVVLERQPERREARVRAGGEVIE